MRQLRSFYVSRANFLTTLCSHLDVTCSCYFGSSLLVVSVGQKLCVNFYLSRANFLTTLRSHLDVTRSCYFWSSLFNMDDESLHTLNK